MAIAEKDLNYRKDRFRDALDKVLGAVSYTKKQEENEANQETQNERSQINPPAADQSQNSVHLDRIGETQPLNISKKDEKEEEHVEINLTQNQLINIDPANNEDVGFYTGALDLETREPEQMTPEKKPEVDQGSAKVSVAKRRPVRGQQQQKPGTKRRLNPVAAAVANMLGKETHELNGGN